jgi:hypothetical protein
LLARGRKALDRQFLQSLANPVEPRRGGHILKWEYQVDAFLREGMRRVLRKGSDLLGSDGARREKKEDGEYKPEGIAGC